MILDKNLFKNILTESNENLIEDILFKIKCIDSIQKDLEYCKIELKKIDNEYNQKTKAVQDKINIIRQKCNHELTTYYGDPAGGSDSYTICDICGKEIK